MELQIAQTRHPSVADRQSGPITRPAFAKVTQVKIAMHSHIGLFYCRTMPILNTLGKCESFVFVITSIRENVQLISRTSLGQKIRNCCLKISFLIFTTVNIMFGGMEILRQF